MVFVYFTIKGDSLDLNQIREDIPLDAKIYEKGKVYHGLNQSLTHKPQKTNRWCYYLEAGSHKSINAVLKQMYEELKPHLKNLQQYTKKYHSLIDVVIYVEEITARFNLQLSKKSIEILNRINSKVSITFVDF